MRNPQCILAAGLTLLLAGCSSLFSEARDWKWMEAVGGVRIDPPYEAGGKLMLPVACDVSGLQTITRKPTAMNSALIVHKISVEREGEALFLQVHTTLTDKKRNALCQPVELRDLPPGEYTVFYGPAPSSFRTTT